MTMLERFVTVVAVLAILALALKGTTTYRKRPAYVFQAEPMGESIPSRPQISTPGFHKITGQG